MKWFTHVLNILISCNTHRCKSHMVSTSEITNRKAKLYIYIVAKTCHCRIFSDAHARWLSCVFKDQDWQSSIQQGELTKSFQGSPIKPQKNHMIFYTLNLHVSGERVLSTRFSESSRKIWHWGFVLLEVTNEAVGGDWLAREKRSSFLQITGFEKTIRCLTCVH